MQSHLSMEKTLLKHFTFIDTAYQAAPHIVASSKDSLADLVGELRVFLNQAKRDTLSPREEAINNILNIAKLTQ